MIANEIIDSFPVKVALWQPKGQILELGIRINDEGDLEFQNRLADDTLIKRYYTVKIKQSKIVTFGQLLGC